MDGFKIKSNLATKTISETKKVASGQASERTGLSSDLAPPPPGLVAKPPEPFRNRY